MNPWEPVPTKFQRWMWRHQTPLRVGALAVMAGSVVLGTYQMATVGLNASIAGAVAGLAGSVSALISIHSIASYVGRWTRENGELQT